MEASLNGQQRQQLDVALLLIGSTKQHRLGTLTTSPGISPETIREEIDGKDFEEIIALGESDWNDDYQCAASEEMTGNRKTLNLGHICRSGRKSQRIS